MKYHFTNKIGSTLIVLVITIAITIVLGATLLNVTMMNYKIKKSNTELKQSLYLSESGLNMAYVDAHNLVSDGIKDSIEKTQDYLSIYPLNEAEAENILVNNYKLFIIENIKTKIFNNSNPYVEVSDEFPLIFINDKLTVCIQSKYFNGSNIIKVTSVNLIINVPNYDDVINDSIDVYTLLKLENWVLSM